MTLGDPRTHFPVTFTIPVGPVLYLSCLHRALFGFPGKRGPASDFDRPANGELQSPTEVRLGQTGTSLVYR